MNTLDILYHLNGLLPLKERQNAVPRTDANVHRSILRSFAGQGRPENKRAADTETLERLHSKDLIVLDGQGRIVGAYPFTLERTPHRLTISGHRLHAMCALDALAVSPMFDCEVQIDSQCALSGEPINIRQRGQNLLEVKPAENLLLGIHWQPVTGCAAHSLCREMVFLRDLEAAMAWQQTDPEPRELFELQEAVQIAAQFFAPLMQEETA